MTRSVYVSFVWGISTVDIKQSQLQMKWIKKQEELKIKQKDFMQEAKDREKRVQTLKKAVESHKAAVQHSERIFDELISSIQKRQAEMREKISAQEKEVQEVENHIQTLEQEIRTLQKDNDTLEPLLHTEDHIHFFQNYPSCSEFLSYTILLKDFNNLLTTENVNKSLSELKGQLDKICEEHMGRKSVGDILKSKIVSVSRRRATVREVEGHPLYITTRSSEHPQSDIRARPSERHQSDIRTRSLERHQSDIRPRSSAFCKRGKAVWPRTYNRMYDDYWHISDDDDLYG
uniref:TRIM8/14/16/25/29/45/65 coiled-coil region domain-containing protein n=1 Tax=Cyprinus carpio TaxID=7962 RepID=A0A8C2J957_CYPCA